MPADPRALCVWSPQMVGCGMVALGLCGSQTCGFFNLDLSSQMLIIGVFAAGALMLLVAILGHAGMYNESREALGIVSVLLVVLCAAEVGAGVLAFVNKDKVARSLSKLYKTVYMQYMNKRDQRAAIALHIFHYGVSDSGTGGRGAGEKEREGQSKRERDKGTGRRGGREREEM
ncbi:UNVERIFIED_CONTAM: hypothetical protein FKN15_010025 [Acipenser sinensis]